MLWRHDGRQRSLTFENLPAAERFKTLVEVVWRLMSPNFFNGITLPRRSHDRVLEPAVATTPHFGLPDSGDMPTVIAQDLSNLPPEETALDPETGEEFTKA